jgi:hypothetical protein
MTASAAIPRIPSSVSQRFSAASDIGLRPRPAESRAQPDASRGWRPPLSAAGINKLILFTELRECRANPLSRQHYSGQIVAAIGAFQTVESSYGDVSSTN